MQVNARPTVQTFVAGSPWGSKLAPADLDKVLAVVEEAEFGKNIAVVHASRPARHWMGLISGLIAQSVTQSDGHTTFLSAVGEGAWFGEGTLMNRGNWGYDAVALQASRVALIPLATFEWLRESSLPFNHFLQAVMNARLSKFTSALLSGRHSSTEGRVATALANLVEQDGVERRTSFVRISQSELAMLTGTSRQRVNDALRRLHELGVLNPTRQGVEVLDVARIHAIASSGQ